MTIFDFAALISAVLIFFYGVRLLIKTGASDFYYLELEAERSPHRFYFSKTIDPKLRPRVRRLIALASQMRVIIDQTDDADELDRAYHHIKNVLQELRQLTAIDGYQVLHFLHSLAREIEIRKMDTTLRDFECI